MFYIKNNWKNIFLMSLIITNLFSSQVEAQEVSEMAEEFMIYRDYLVIDSVDPLNIKTLAQTNTICNILEKYDITYEQFDIIVAIVLAESKYNSYTDAYAVINTLGNRIKSKKFISFVNAYGNGDGKNIFYQATCPNQYVVYQNGSYKKYLGNRELPGYKAVIDYLDSEENMHNFLQFRSSFCDSTGRIQFDEDGNLFFDPLLEEDRIVEISKLDQKQIFKEQLQKNKYDLYNIKSLLETKIITDYLEENNITYDDYKNKR